MTRASDTARLLGAGGTFGGAITSNSGIAIDDITIDGTEIDLSGSGDFSVDVGGDIILDADSRDIKLQDGGTDWGLFQRDTSTVTSSFVVKAMKNDSDLKLRGVDNNSEITALTLDMSDAGTATFNHDVIVSSGDVVIGTSAASANLHVQGTSGNDQVIVGNSAEATQFRIRVIHDDQTVLMSRDGDTARHLVFQTGITEKARIQDNGNFLIGTTNQSPAESSSATGLRLGGNGGTQISTSGLEVMRINRNTNDGTLINFSQGSTSEGHISVSGTTVTYNGGHLGRWSQLENNTRDDTIVKGTVMTNLDKMAEWTTDGVTEDNEQLNCMAVSSVEGDINVAGVFVNWDNDDKVYTNDMNVAMTGDMVIRIAKGTTVARGDLLMSAGDGTAKPQGDDIVRSKTIAKVTSTNVSHTYDDGTYLVPCVVMAC